MKFICFFKGYISLYKYYFLIFHVSSGAKVATKNDKNNKDCETKLGNRLLGNNIPIKIDLEKSGLGNKSNPANKPIIIET